SSSSAREILLADAQGRNLLTRFGPEPDRNRRHVWRKAVRLVSALILSRQRTVMTDKDSAPAGAAAACVPERAAPDEARLEETLSAALNANAQFALEAGDLDKAELLLAEAERFQASALERHAYDAAKTLALRGGIALAHQRFSEAAESFAAAAEIL